MKKMKEFVKKYSTWIIGGLVSLGLATALLVVLWPKAKVEAPVVTEAPVIAPVEISMSRPYRAYAKKPVEIAPLPQPAYLDALRTHASTRIQLDEQCRPTPISMVIKGGQEIMVDNRAGMIREIDFGGKKTVVPAYGFVFIKTDIVTSNQDILLDCGAQQNVIHITIEP